MCHLTLHRNMHAKFGMIWTYSDKVMLRQGNLDANDDDKDAAAATADESNPYISPFQTTQKLSGNQCRANKDPGAII